MRNPAYAAFSALDPFFDIVRQGLAGERHRRPSVTMPVQNARTCLESQRVREFGPACVDALLSRWEIAECNVGSVPKA
jgi:hypothetical protein